MNNYQKLSEENILPVISENIDGVEKRAVSVRDLVEKIGIKTHPNTWFLRNAEKYGFEEGLDYAVFKNENPLVSTSADVLKDYIVPLDTAKELCMIANTEKGRDVRKYFIEIEKKNNQPQTFEEIMNNALRLADQRVTELQAKIEEDKPKVAFAKAIEGSESSVKIQDWIKSVNIEGRLKLGRNKIFKWFRENGFLQKDNRPYQRFMDQGLFELKEGLVTTTKGQINTFTTLLTGKGQTYFTDKIINI